jgi:hypothetical protein
MSFVKVTLCSWMPRVTVYKSARVGGPFSRQSFRLTPEGLGCLMLLFMQILSGVVECGPVLNASTMLM